MWNMESLEGRQLLATSSGLFSASINFQPPGATVPHGYVADTGAVYGVRAGGVAYGWNTSNTETSNRDHSASPDQRYDTLNRIQSDALKWELAVPNGRYFVRLVSGDPTKFYGEYRTEVEGQIIIDDQPSRDKRWISGYATVNVADGRLTLRNGEGASNNKVNFIDVHQVDSIDFRVFDSLGHIGKPDLSPFNIDDIYVTGNEIWKGSYPNYDMSKPDEAATRALARKVAALGVPLVIDIEHWKFDIRTASRAAVQSSIDKLRLITQWVHDEAPAVEVGFYGIVPLRDYWSPVQYFTALERQDEPWYKAKLPEFQASYLDWVEANEFVTQRLAGYVDFVAPSLYTFYDDPEGWQKYAEANLDEAAKAGLPVYAFVMPEYHLSNKQLGGKAIDGAYWQDQLVTIRSAADGVVLFGGWDVGGREQWRSNAEWWTETPDFAGSL